MVKITLQYVLCVAGHGSGDYMSMNIMGCLHLPVCVGCKCMFFVFTHTRACICIWMEIVLFKCLTHTCSQERPWRHRLPVGGRADGGAGGRQEEVQSQWAGQHNQLFHSASEDVSPTQSLPTADRLQQYSASNARGRSVHHLGSSSCSVRLVVAAVKNFQTVLKWWLFRLWLSAGLCASSFQQLTG